MKRRRLVDANLIIRYLVQDDENDAKVAGKLIDAWGRGELKIVILPEVLAESVFVLESFYQRTRPDIAQGLKGLIASPGIEIGKQTIRLDALDRYQRTKIHFVDCLIAATAAAEDAPVASFDQDFRKFADVRVETQ